MSEKVPLLVCWFVVKVVLKYCVKSNGLCHKCLLCVSRSLHELPSPVVILNPSYSTFWSKMKFALSLWPVPASVFFLIHTHPTHIGCKSCNFCLVYTKMLKLSMVFSLIWLLDMTTCYCLQSCICHYDSRTTLIWWAVWSSCHACRKKKK